MESKRPNLQAVLKSAMSEYEKDNPEEEHELMEYDGDSLIESMSNFNATYGTLTEAVKNIREILSSVSQNTIHASHHIMKEASRRSGGDSFSEGLVKENSKEIRKLGEELKDSIEASLTPLMKALVVTENIGVSLDRYYDIK